MKENDNANKKRTAIWLYPKTFQKMDNSLHTANCKNRSEYIEKALDFYMGYWNAKDSTVFLSESLVGAVKGTVENTEQRMANNLFRLSVEMNIMMNILAAGLEIEEEQLSKLRSRCVREVKKSKGKIAFEDALAFQME